MAARPWASVVLAAMVLLVPIAGGAQTPNAEETKKEGETDTTTATPPVVVLPSVTTTATRSTRSLFETPARVDVITRDQMDRHMDQTIEDLVRQVPGVFVNRQTTGTDPFNSLGGFTIRGVSGNRVQTLIDGNRVIERITDQTRDVVDLTHMKRVEIVHGPGSVLWGADALGGIVAFTTKDPADYLKPGKNWAAQVDFTYNSYDDAFTERFTVAGRVGKFEAMFAYTRRDANEGTLSNARSPNGVWTCPRAPESNPCNLFDPTTVGSNNFLSKFVWNFSKDNKLKLTMEYFGRRTDVNQLWDHGRGVTSSGALSTTTTLDYRRRQELTRYRIGLEQDWKTNLSFLDAVKWSVVFHPQKLERSGNRLQETAGVQTRRIDLLTYDETFYEADLQFKSSFDLGPSKHQLTYGFDGSIMIGEYYRKDVTTNLATGATTTAVAGGFNFANSRTERADVYIQDEISFLNRRILITPGMRYSTYRITPNLAEGYEIVPGAEPREIFEDNLSFQVGAIAKITKTYSVYARYAEGFKMPTAQQLYTSLDGAPFFNLVPNPNLKPESVRSYEIGLRGKFRRGFFSVNAFYARYKDFIQSFVSVPGTIDITYDNISRVDIWGVEGKGRYQFLPEWSISGSFTWQKGVQKDDPNSRDYRPFSGASPFKLTGGLRWSRPRWGLDVEFMGTYQAATEYTNDVPNAKFHPGSYFVFDSVVQWKPRPWITLHAGVFNIFDQRYFLPSASSFDRTPSSASVAATNPLELQTQPGRTFRVGFTLKF